MSKSKGKKNKAKRKPIWKILEEILQKEKEDHKEVQFRFTDVLHKTLTDASLVTLNDVTFSFSHFDNVIEQLNFTIYPGTRAGIIGLNGSGKSVLLKLIVGELELRGHNSVGHIWRQDGLKIGLFHQHSFQEKFEKYLDKTPLNYFFDIFGAKRNLKMHEVRCFLARFGIEDQMPLRNISTFSGGEKTRLAMAEIAFSEPHILLFDEPTNHLDMHTIDAFIDGLKNYRGAFIVVSHNQYIFSEKHGLVEDIWTMEEKKVKKLNVSFAEYKSQLQNQMLK